MPNDDDLISLLKERLEAMLDKNQKEIEFLKEQEIFMRRLRSTFSGDLKEGIKKLISMPAEEIYEYAQFVKTNYKKEEIMEYKYVLNETAFINTGRYRNAKKRFEELVQKIRSVSMKRVPHDELQIAEQTCDAVRKFLEHIVDGKIIGGIEDIDSLIALFDYSPLNQFKADEKKAIIKQLLVSDLSYLKNYTEELEIEMMIQQEERIRESGEVIDINDEATDSKKAEETSLVEVLDVELPEKFQKEIGDNSYRSITPQEKLDILNSIYVYCQKVVEGNNPKTQTHKKRFDELALSLKNDEYEVGVVLSIVVSDKNIVYILARYLIMLIEDLNEFLDAKYDADSESMMELVDDQLNSIGATYKIIKESIDRMKKDYYEEKVVPEQVKEVQESKFNLIFVKNGLESYFSKSLSELRDYENVLNIEKILKDLENGKFSNDRKIGDFKYKIKGSFAIFYKVKSGHVFVFNILLARDISTRKTDIILNSITYEDAFKAVAEKGEEYQEMMEDSKKERELLRVMLGVAEGGYQP